MCKKELSSNRINDPLASIYRTRGGRAARTNSSNCLRRGDGARQLFPRRPFAARSPRAENIICFLAVRSESLCRRRKFNRPLSFSGRACKSCFRLHRLHRFPLVGYRTPAVWRSPRRGSTPRATTSARKVIRKFEHPEDTSRKIRTSRETL